MPQRRRYFDLDSLHLGATRNLTHVFIDNTAVVGLEPLSNHKGLRFLDIHKTRVSDLAPIEDLDQLEYLSCRDCPISDLEPLASLTRIKQLYLDGTRVSDLRPLKRLQKLGMVGSQRHAGVGSIAVGRHARTEVTTFGQHTGQATRAACKPDDVRAIVTAQVQDRRSDRSPPAQSPGNVVSPRHNDGFPTDSSVTASFTDVSDCWTVDTCIFLATRIRSCTHRALFACSRRVCATQLCSAAGFTTVGGRSPGIRAEACGAARCPSRKDGYRTREAPAALVTSQGLGFRRRTRLCRKSRAD